LYLLLKFGILQLKLLLKFNFQKLNEKG